MSQRRANVIGLGLIGGSIAAGLRERGWQVVGVDSAAGVEDRAIELGVIDAAGELDRRADLTIVATPVGHVAEAVRRALDETDGLVTDVGSVKASIAAAVEDPRFVPGHPMAGSEQDGLSGARPDMFSGAVWVLTPTAATSDAAFATVRDVVASLGADVVALAPDQHDRMVAMVSHVPHLTAVTLMRLADDRAAEHAALLRLAAGGFRDMTRIAAGHPGIWPDICAANQTAVVDTLDALIGALGEVRSQVAGGDRAGLLANLTQARRARMNLPSGAPRPENLAEVRVPVLDRKGEIAAVASLAAELDANIYDLEIAHSSEGQRGVITLVVDAARAERLIGGLMANGYRPSSQPLE